MRVINNQDRIADHINNLELDGVSAVGDDGSVIVNIEGSTGRTLHIAEMIASENLDADGIGDGVQEGSIFINNDENNIHEELVDFIMDNQ